MKSYTGNLLQFWWFVKNDVTNKAQKLTLFWVWTWIWPTVFLKREVVFLESVSINKYMFHKKIPQLTDQQNFAENQLTIEFHVSIRDGARYCII